MADERKDFSELSDETLKEVNGGAWYMWCGISFDIPNPPIPW